MSTVLSQWHQVKKGKEEKDRERKKIWKREEWGKEKEEEDERKSSRSLVYCTNRIKPP